MAARLLALGLLGGLVALEGRARGGGALVAALLDGRGSAPFIERGSAIEATSGGGGSDARGRGGGRSREVELEAADVGGEGGTRGGCEGRAGAGARGSDGGFGYEVVIRGECVVVIVELTGAVATLASALVLHSLLDDALQVALRLFSFRPEENAFGSRDRLDVKVPALGARTLVILTHDDPDLASLSDVELAWAADGSDAEAGPLIALAAEADVTSCSLLRLLVDSAASLYCQFLALFARARSR